MFLSDPGLPAVRSMRICSDVNLADEDTNSILTGNANRAIQDYVAIQLTKCGGQICNLYKWCHVVVKFATNVSGAIRWPNLD